MFPGHVCLLCGLGTRLPKIVTHTPSLVPRPCGNKAIHTPRHQCQNDMAVASSEIMDELGWCPAGSLLCVCYVTGQQYNNNNNFFFVLHQDPKGWVGGVYEHCKFCVLHVHVDVCVLSSGPMKNHGL